MARPTKPGLDYSQIDTDFSRKELAMKVRRKFGLEGLAVLYETIVWINEGKGCYVECESVAAAAELFATTRLFDLNKCDWVESIFEFMLEIGFFDANALVQDKILTSEGIARRWFEAKKSGWESKKRPCPYALPESVRDYLRSLEKDFTPNPTKNTPNPTKNTPNPPVFTPNCHKVKESKVIKQTNKQTSAESSAEIPQASATPEPAVSANPIPDTEPTPFRSWPEADAEARGRENWHRARDLAKGSLFFRGISADLIDAAAVCLVHGWIGTGGLRNIQRKARDALDVYGSSGGRRGKANGWETVRDCVSLAIREQGIEPPAYSRKNPEPPPIKP